MLVTGDPTAVDCDHEQQQHGHLNRAEVDQQPVLSSSAKMLLGAVIICIHSAIFLLKIFAASAGRIQLEISEKEIRLAQILNSDMNKYAVDEREYTYFDLILYNFTQQIF